ncbi:unconventional myosin-XVIIIa isoform X4 [Agrilus planipennis]|uniref:Unconventional myosin-XVIIIa isoform X4 n=1 Tax=Agrilus planipennis TaxID=224129 RepID=A0A1W4WNK4_AGRPL|nr:unconventional myosin-XVIIIa isoform X4 [Agrilus planipennis]
MYSFFESSLRNSKRTFSFRDDPQKHHKSCSGVAHASGKYNATSDEYNRTCKIHEKRNCKSCEIPKNVPSFQKVSSLSSDGHSETESVESGTQEEPFDRNKPENKSLKKKFAAFKRSDSAPVNLGVKKDNTATKSDDRASKNPQEIRRERLKQILNSRASPTQNKSFEESLVPTFPTKKEENNCSSFRRRFPSFRRSGSAPDKLGNAKPKEVKDDFDVHLGGSSKDPRAERRQRLKEILKSRASFRAEPGQRRSYTKSCNSDHSFDEIKIPATSTIAAAAATSVINKPEKIEFKTSLRVSFNRKFGHTTVSGDYYKNVVPTVSKNNIAQKSVKVEESVHHQPATESVPQSKPQVPPKPSVKPVNVVVVGGGRLRTSFRKSIKKLQKIKTATWEELYNIALNRKATIGDEGSYLKSWNDFILQRLEEEGIEQAKTEDQIANEIEWLDAERVWLVHRGGFTCAKKITTTAEGDIGKLRIQIDQTGEILEVDEDDLEKLSEMTADLAEEHSTSTLATERLEAETSERMRLERELTEVQNKNKVLQDSSERLELELLYAKSDLNGISEEDDDGCADNNDANIYKQRYERAKKELEFTKKRLQQQHEDDLEQLVGLKKQLEKKLTDAYEEVEEQKQVVGQWKRKVQKLNSETNDLRLLLEEQSARNNLLEKKQRKFDSEMQLLQDELRSERQARDRLSREKDVILTEKYNVETNLADTKLELELKEEKLRALQKELDELTHGGKTEEEIAVLRKQKMDMERRLLDQEEELDELAGQVQLLEQSKVRLEMSLEQQRKEAKKEAQQRDDEIEEIRCNAQKKVKALEAQLENEHEERTQLLRDKHELERRLTAFAESDRNDRAGDEALLQRLKRDLKRSKVLLRDTQAQLDRQKSENPSKAVIRQLRNQIEDLDYARSSAVKAKQSVETELFELQTTLEETQKGRHDAEEKVNSLSREKSDLQAQLEENEEELAEVLKKYKAAVQQMSLDQLALQEQVSLVSELEAERNTLKEQLAEVTSKLESAENIGEASSNLLVKRLELKNKELESKLDLEQTTRSRLETQITRLKEAVDKLQNEIVSHRTKEQLAQENVRKLQKNIRELKEELGHHQSKENEWLQKKKELEKRCECLEVEASASKADLKLALKRIEDLQAAIQGDLEEGTTESDSEQVSYSSEESLNSFPSKLSLKPTGFDGERRLVWNQLSGTSKSSSMSNSQGKDGSFA